MPVQKVLIVDDSKTETLLMTAIHNRDAFIGVISNSMKSHSRLCNR